MVRVNLASGETETIDLSVPSGVDRWNSLPLEAIRAVSIVVRDRDGDSDLAQFVCPRPKGVRVVRWTAELVEHEGRRVSEVVTCYGDLHSVALCVYVERRPIVARVDWTRAGRLRLSAPF